MPPEPQPELVLLSLGHLFVILPLEEPVAFIEEADIADEPLALVVFEHHFFMEAEPLNVNPPFVSFLWLYSFTLSRD